MKALSQSFLMLLQLVCNTLRAHGRENCGFVFILTGGRISKIFIVFLCLVILVLCDIFRIPSFSLKSPISIMLTLQRLACMAARQQKEIDNFPKFRYHCIF